MSRSLNNKLFKCGLAHLILIATPGGKCYLKTHFHNENTETYGEYVTCTMSTITPRPGFKPRSM